MERATLDFERPIVELERQIDELRAVSATPELASEIAQLEQRADTLRKEIFSELSPWQKVQLSRHPLRPYTLDYIERLLNGFVELHGDRRFADDEAIVSGFGWLRSMPKRPIALIGHQKGRTTKENVRRNFGMPRPEGYRKARRIMELASRFGRPVVTLVDTPGAYPGIDAEERGQSEAIAANLECMATLPVPIVSCVIGEGGSGGALAVGVADAILMFEYSTYSVISPEGCASILWRDQAKGPEAAAAMRLDAVSIARLGVVDEILPEPPGGAHRDPDTAAATLGAALARHVGDLSTLDATTLRERRYQKYRRLGVLGNR